MRDRIPFFFYAAITAMILIYAATRFLTTDVQIKGIRVYSDNGKAPSGIARVIAGNIRSLRKIPGEIAMRFPEIEHVSVRNNHTGTLEIRIRHKKSVGVLKSGDAFYPLLKNGVPVDKALAQRPERGVVFQGPLPNDISEIIRIVEGDAALHGQTDYVEYIEGRRWNIRLFGGAVIMMPEIDAPLAAVKIKQFGILDKSFSVLDMRDPRRTLVK